VPIGDIPRAKLSLKSALGPRRGFAGVFVLSGEFVKVISFRDAIFPNIAGDLSWEARNINKCEFGLYFEITFFPTTSAVLCDNVLPHDRTPRFFRRRKKPGAAAETMALGDLPRWQNQPD
jgi:hypothetical protein